MSSPGVGGGGGLGNIIGRDVRANRNPWYDKMSENMGIYKLFVVFPWVELKPVLGREGI